MLHDFLAKRDINRNGNKEILVANAKNAFMMNIPIIQSDVQEEIEEIKRDLNDKLCLENGLIQLPNPVQLEDGWVLAPTNLPDTMFEQIANFLESNDAGKAYKGGKSLLDSGHLSNTILWFTPLAQICDTALYVGFVFQNKSCPRHSTLFGLFFTKTQEM